MKGQWVEMDIRDGVIDLIQYWSEKTQLSKKRFLREVGLPESKYYDWKKRYGKVNIHNGQIPRDYWLAEWEIEAIKSFFMENPDEGYRRLTYMMMDQDIVAVSPSTTYNVLRTANLLGKQDGKLSSKGKGFTQPENPHIHWHIDISYINISGTFYYMCTILEGYSRSVLHYEIRETMKEADVEIILHRARERYPDTKPRIISDNGPQFIAKDFKSYVRQQGMTHVRTSPYYPQSNGKIERYHKTIKQVCIRKKSPESLQQARDYVKEFVTHYNTERLHSAIGYVTPRDKLDGNEGRIFIKRKTKIAQARARRVELMQAKKEVA